MGWRLTLTSSPLHSFRQAPSSLLFSCSPKPAGFLQGVSSRARRGTGQRFGRASCGSEHGRRRLEQPRVLGLGPKRDGTGQLQPSPPYAAAPHRLTQTCAPADSSGVLACHSSSWQQEGSSRKWFIIPSFIRSALGSLRGEEPWDVQEASASDGPVKGLRRWTRPLQPPSQLPPPSPLLPHSFHSHSSPSPLCLPSSPPPWGGPPVLSPKRGPPLCRSPSRLWTTIHRPLPPKRQCHRHIPDVWSVTGRMRGGPPARAHHARPLSP